MQLLSTILQLLTVVGGIAGAILGGRKLGAIHVTVNGRLGAALTEVENLRNYIEITAKPGDPPIPPRIIAPCVTEPPEPPKP